MLLVHNVASLFGSEQSMLVAAREIIRLGVDARIAIPDGPLLEHVKRLPVDYALIPPARLARSRPIRSLAATCRAGFAILRLIRTTEPDIVHANSIAAGLACAVTRRLWRDIPLIIHIRDLRAPIFSLRMLDRAADSFIAISNAVQRWLISSGILTKTTVIPNGIDVKAFLSSALRGAFRKEIDAAPNDVIALMAAQMVPWKRHEDFLRALARARERMHTS